MQRILIVGSGGSGKSTLARQLGDRLNMEVIHLDQHYFGPNWEEPSKEEWAKRVQQLIQRPNWVMDGNYGGTMEMRIGRADTIIFLDFSRWLCLWRVLKRGWRNRGRVRPDMAPECKERVEWQFLWYIFRYPDTRRAGVFERISRLASDKDTYILQSPKQVKHFLQEALI